MIMGSHDIARPYHAGKLREDIPVRKEPQQKAPPHLELAPPVEAGVTSEKMRLEAEQPHIRASRLRLLLLT